ASNTQELQIMKYRNHRLSAAMWSRVLLPWLILGVGPLVVGGVALVLGRFIRDAILAELDSQQITFSLAQGLIDEEQDILGIVENAGQPLLTGNQAKVYSEYIGLHMQQSAEGAGYPGAAYATLGGVQSELRAAVAEARESGDEEALAEAEAELATVTSLRNT